METRAVKKSLHKACKHHPERASHKNTGLCLACLQERARKSAASRAAKKRATPITSPEKPASPAPESGGSCSISIDFSNYPALYEKLQKLAFQGFRSLQGQLLFLISQAQM
jgi:hypothetical protein